MDLRASWPSSLIKMVTPRLREVVSKTKKIIEETIQSQNHSCLYSYIPERDRGQKGRRGRGEGRGD